MKTPSVLLFYGLDEASHAFEIESTLSVIKTINDALIARGWRVLPLQVTHDLATPLRAFDPREWVVFNMCEGAPAQAFYYAKATRALAELGFHFTGSEAWSLDETQYKWRMKAVMDDAGVPTPKWATFERAEDVRFDVFPAIVKPAAEHCSYGITRESVVMNEIEARRQTARVIADFKQPALIEEFLDSPEYNVTVWGDGGEVSVLGISSMTYDAFDDIHDRLCTFDAKWTPGSEAYQRIPAVCPAPVSDALKCKIEAVSIAAYRSSGCRDYGRVDLRLRGDEPMALDINANCDVSQEGGFANAARAAGLSYGELMERLVLMAVQRMHVQRAPALVEVRA